jgi:hypothetical protein
MKRPLSPRSVERMRKREASVGLDPDDAAAQWLGENEPKPEVPVPKAPYKSKALHRWRQRNAKP